MELHFFGHAAVGLHCHSTQQKILIDPYEPGGFGGLIGYSPMDFQPDLICLTHEHLDHAHIAPFPQATVLGPTDYTNWPQQKTTKPCKINTLRVAHDAFEGTLRGGHSWCLLFTFDDLRILHLGDIGECPPQHALDHLTQGEPVDILLATCGGYFTIGADQAAELSRRLQARVTIPIHYRTEACTLPHMVDMEGMRVRFAKHMRHEGPLHLTPGDLPAPGTLLELVPSAI